MALIKCPSCGGQISDKAASCVHCGCPMSASEFQSKSDDIILVEQNQPTDECSSELEKAKKKLNTSKKIISIVAAIIAIILLVVLILTHKICVKHSYSEASVLAPQTCYHCGKTIGEQKALTEIEFPAKGAGALLPIPNSNMGEINWDESDSFNVYVGNTTESDFDAYVKACSEYGFDVDYQKGNDYYYAKDIYGNDLNVWHKGNNIMQIQIIANVEGEDNIDVAPSLPEDATDDTQGTYTLNGCFTYTARSFMERFDKAYDDIGSVNYLYMRSDNENLYYELADAKTYDDFRTIGMIGFDGYNGNALSIDDDFTENIISAITVLIEDVDDVPMVLVGCMCAADPSLDFASAYNMGESVVECAGTEEGYTQNGINYVIVTDDEYYFIIISVATTATEKPEQSQTPDAPIETNNTLHQHTYSNASCTDERMCNSCGEKTSALGHDWKYEDDMPVVCKRCAISYPCNVSFTYSPDCFGILAGNEDIRIDSISLSKEVHYSEYEDEIYVYVSGTVTGYNASRYSESITIEIGNRMDTAGGSLDLFVPSGEFVLSEWTLIDDIYGNYYLDGTYNVDVLAY